MESMRSSYFTTTTTTTKLMVAVVGGWYLLRKRMMIIYKVFGKVKKSERYGELVRVACCVSATSAAKGDDETLSLSSLLFRTHGDIIYYMDGVVSNNHESVPSY
jgi:hypothetical protein